MNLVRSIVNMTFQYVNKAGQIQEICVPAGLSPHGAILSLYDKMWESNPNIIAYSDDDFHSYKYRDLINTCLGEIYVQSSYI